MPQTFCAVSSSCFADADSPVVPANDGGNVSEGASEIAGERPASNQHNADLVNAVSKQQVVVNFLKVCCLLEISVDFQS